MSLIFEARALRRDYGSITALDLPEFLVEQGECVVLTGRNGSGKSTLLRLLAFLETPTSGTLKYFGTGGPASPDTARTEISLLLQEPYLMKADIFWNVTLGLTLRGISLQERRIRYETAMRDAGFADPASMAARSFRALSGGEKQRVALASRLILRPRVLLLDEPTSNVDMASLRTVTDVIRRCHENGMTVICATHDTELIQDLNAREIKLSPPMH